MDARPFGALRRGFSFCVQWKRDNPVSDSRAG
jgi:hypothetical protein